MHKVHLSFFLFFLFLSHPSANSTSFQKFDLKINDLSSVSSTVPIEIHPLRSFFFRETKRYKILPNLETVKNIGREQLAEANWRRSVFCIPGGGGFIEMRTREQQGDGGGVGGGFSAGSRGQHSHGILNAFLRVPLYLVTVRPTYLQYLRVEVGALSTRIMHSDASCKGTMVSSSSLLAQRTIN